MEKKKNLNRRFYKWHRILGLIGLVPIICWTVSGLSHPFMSNWFRPYIPEETYQRPTQTELKPQLSLKQVLDQNHIAEFRNYGLIGLKQKTYYQILQKDSTSNYYAATDGNLLPNGDRDYAIYLARYFTQDSVSKIKSATIQKTFDGQYQPINHLLPVWKISFYRPDGMDIYVETTQSRLGTFNNNTRKIMLGVFEQLHTWDFMADWFGDTFRLIFMTGIVTVLFLSLVTGIIIYGLFWNRFKEIAQKRKTKNGHDKRWVHRYHRQLGLIMSVIMLMFFSSAAFHLLVKLRNAGALPDYQQIINSKTIQKDNLHLPIADSLINKQAIVSFRGSTYYQITDVKKNIRYFDVANGVERINGDQDYAAYLSEFYRSGVSSEKAEISPIRQFDHEYGFINKRLPVQKVSYPGDDNWYIETTTAKLATHVEGIDRAEGLSFIFLHKFFWMTWAGKNVRDAVSIVCALSILIVSLLGFAAFLKKS